MRWARQGSPAGTSHQPALTAVYDGSGQGDDGKHAEQIDDAESGEDEAQPAPAPTPTPAPSMAGTLGALDGPGAGRPGPQQRVRLPALYASTVRGSPAPRNASPVNSPSWPGMLSRPRVAGILTLSSRY